MRSTRWPSSWRAETAFTPGGLESSAVRYSAGSSSTPSYTRTPPLTLGKLVLGGVLVVAGYGFALHSFTDAYAPFLDSAILAFSVVGQLLLVQRRVESWFFWLLVNSLAVPVYWLRGLQLTSLLYAAYWVNALISLRSWRLSAS